MHARLGPILIGFLFASSLLVHTASSQNVRELIGQLRKAGSQQTADTTVTKYLGALSEESQIQERLRGNVSFGLNGDETDGEQLYKINAGITLSRGQYPTEVEFESRVGVTLDGTEFKENVSDLRLTYDYYPALNWETFVFLDRRSDNFMSINQRYEIGGGIVFDQFLGLTEDGTQRIDDLALFDKARPAMQLSAAEQKVLKQAHQQAVPAAQKRYARTRLALLFGVFAEFEQATLTRTDSTGSDIEEQALGTRSKLRWELRPTLDLQPVDGLELKIRPYLKLPPPWNTKETIRTGDTRETRADYRLDLYTDLSIDLTDADVFGGGGVTLTLSYQLLYDHAPPYILAPSETGEPIPLRAEDLHHVVRLTFGVRFR